MRLIVPALLVLVILATGCSPVPEGDVSVDEGEPLYFENVTRGQSAVMRDTLETVVRTSSEWAELAEQFRPVTPFPDIDFSQTMVGVISIPADAGGYSIEVESVEVVDSTLVVDYVLNVPGSSCITVQALAEPFQVFSIRQAETSGHRFQRRIEHYSCELE